MKLELSMSCAATGVHNPLRDALVIEMLDLFSVMEVCMFLREILCRRQKDHILPSSRVGPLAPARNETSVSGTFTPK